MNFDRKNGTLFSNWKQPHLEENVQETISVGYQIQSPLNESKIIMDDFSAKNEREKKQRND